jgi:hypothetical protein
MVIIIRAELGLLIVEPLMGCLPLINLASRAEVRLLLNCECCTYLVWEQGWQQEAWQSCSEPNKQVAPFITKLHTNSEQQTDHSMTELCSY